ncbi:SMAD/FHA domain-containing protein [Hygrophoropsis aurantiaca]|uniref:SMAD/FHA domain-containing protein n=1 Tax=Hygrophoropsis aurantiaca TaxID=72124 RepID=A0ACB8AEG5_9AGAM|nr:SMAD/FHA domain-containing protein [Hygrophoropsis aurantiaca]
MRLLARRPTPSDALYPGIGQCRNVTTRIKFSSSDVNVLVDFLPKRRDRDFKEDRNAQNRENGRYREDKRDAGRRDHDSRRDDRTEDNYRYSRRDREDSERERRKNWDENRDKRSARRRSNSRARGGPSRRSASPRNRSGSPARSKSPPLADKAKPNFAQSGLLAAATNTVKAADGTSTVLKYNEPPEARKPPLGWRLYVFKGDEQTELLHIHRQSAYLIGRDRTVADITIEHPSCSKQHAVIQHRQIHEKDEFGGSKPIVKPFIIDLESTNGTHVNNEAIPTSRYYELKANDVIKFGQSTREYVLLHDDAV